MSSDLLASPAGISMIVESKPAAFSDALTRPAYSFATFESVMSAQRPGLRPASRASSPARLRIPAPTCTGCEADPSSTRKLRIAWLRVRGKLRELAPPRGLRADVRGGR